MTRIVRFMSALAFLWLAGAAVAQEVWIQIEAQPGRGLAEARATEWDEQLDDVSVYSTGGRWYAVVLGPYSEADARLRLLGLRSQRAIPQDAFITDGRGFGEAVFAGARGSLNPGPQIAAPAPEPILLNEPEETIAEARASERLLTSVERRDIQRALAYEGFYRAGIDGAFGPGTRRSIENWQAANLYETTGFLTTRQRAQLLEDWRSDIESLGIEPVIDTRAGIEIDLPMALLGAPEYDPPFARYEATDGSGAMVLLISQTGDQTTLAGLYDIMQTLEIVPLRGPRERRRNSFVLTGADASITSHSFAVVDRGAVKGFTLVWPTGDEKRRGLVLAALEASFDTLPGVLPEIADGSVQSLDLLAGLEIRRPERARTGFFVSRDGAVLTSNEAVETCGRITLGPDTNATIVAEDTTTGLALLRPENRLAPIATARLTTSAPRLQSEVAVAGYSFGGALGAPTLTFGNLADVRGLDGDPGTDRLALVAEPGDAGGPVFDAAGGVVGMLRPRSTDTGRVLPESVNFATDATVIAEFLSNAGVSAAAAERGDAIPPEDLTRLAADMTVLVNCWN